MPERKECQPGAAEMSHAQDIMTSTQKKLSRSREEAAPYREKLDKLKADRFESSVISREQLNGWIKFELNGHQFYVERKNINDYNAEVDGNELLGDEGHKVARQLYERFNPEIKNLQKEVEVDSDDMQQVQQEVREEFPEQVGKPPLTRNELSDQGITAAREVLALE